MRAVACRVPCAACTGRPREWRGGAVDPATVVGLLRGMARRWPRLPASKPPIGARPDAVALCTRGACLPALWATHATLPVGAYAGRFCPWLRPLRCGGCAGCGVLSDALVGGTLSATARPLVAEIVCGLRDEQYEAARQAHTKLTRACFGEVRSWRGELAPPSRVPASRFAAPAWYPRLLPETSPSPPSPPSLPLTRLVCPAATLHRKHRRRLSFATF